MSSRILIIGGHGKVALRTAPLLVEQGHQVTSVIRNPEHADAVSETGATPLVADVEQLNTDELAALMANHDVVVWSAGAGGGNPPRTYAVDRDAAIRSMDAAAQAGVSRYVMVSYFGARLDHGVEADSTFFPYAEAKSAADEYLRRSELQWTIVAPSGLTLDEPTGRIEVNQDGSLASGTVTRADVAAVIAEVVAQNSTIGKMIEFNNGDTPITEALAD